MRIGILLSKQVLLPLLVVLRTKLLVMTPTNDEPLSRIVSREKNIWKNSNTFQPQVEEFQEEDDEIEMRSSWKPSDYVNEYLGKELFSLMSSCTNLQSVSTKGKNIKTTAAEIERFIGSSILCPVSNIHEFV